MRTTARAASSGARRIRSEHQEAGDDDGADDERDPRPGHRAVVVEDRGAAGHAGLQAALAGDPPGVLLELLADFARAVGVEAVVGDDQHAGRLAAAAHADRLAGERPAAGRGAFEGGEDEVARVEEARVSCGAGARRPLLSGAAIAETRTPERRSPTSSGRERWKPSASPAVRAPAPPCRAPRPSASRPAPEPSRSRPPVSPWEAPSSRPTPRSSRLPPAEIRLRPPLTTLGDVAQAFGFVAGGGDRPGQRPGLPGLRLDRGVAPSRFGELGGELARSLQAASPDLGHERAQAELQGEAADGGLALRLGQFPRAFGEARDPRARLLAAGRGPFQAAGEQAGAFLRPPGSFFEQGAARGAFGQAAAQPGHRAGGAAQAGAEAGEAADALVAVRGQGLAQLAQRLGALGDRARGRSPRGRRAGWRCVAASG